MNVGAGARRGYLYAEDLQKQAAAAVAGAPAVRRQLTPTEGGVRDFGKAIIKQKFSEEVQVSLRHKGDAAIDAIGLLFLLRIKDKNGNNACNIFTTEIIHNNVRATMQAIEVKNPNATKKFPNISINGLCNQLKTEALDKTLEHFVECVKENGLDDILSKIPEFSDGVIRYGTEDFLLSKKEREAREADSFFAPDAYSALREQRIPPSKVPPDGVEEQLEPLFIQHPPSSGGVPGTGKLYMDHPGLGTSLMSDN